MSSTFIIAGYGVPKDILHDENYNIYLKTAFNKIWARTSPDEKVKVLFCGGRTDLFEPYERTEAAEMIRLFTHLVNRSATKARAEKWKLIAEEDSYSTLDNMLNAKALLGNPDEEESIHIIVETTRRKRVETIVAAVFPGLEVDILSIDFDQSNNRYRDADQVVKDEAVTEKFDLFALASEENMSLHKETCKEKFDTLRATPSEKRKEVKEELWKKRLELYKKIGIQV